MALGATGAVASLVVVAAASGRASGTLALAGTMATSAAAAHGGRVAVTSALEQAANTSDIR